MVGTKSINVSHYVNQEGHHDMQARAASQLINCDEDSVEIRQLHFHFQSVHNII